MDYNKPSGDRLLDEVGHHGPQYFYAACNSKKQIQNTNAVKFKLNSMVMNQMRYQVVYKKLVRSMRKFYCRKFVSSGFNLNKEESDKFMDEVREFVSVEFAGDMKKLSFKVEDLARSFSALIHPKLAFKFYEAELEAHQRIQVVYDYLYKFSFERLQEFLNDPVMLMFFIRMLEEKICSNMQTSQPLQALAEQEASLLMIRHSCFSKYMVHVYDGQTLIKKFLDRIQLCKNVLSTQFRPRSHTTYTFVEAIQSQASPATNNE